MKRAISLGLVALASLLAGLFVVLASQPSTRAEQPVDPGAVYDPIVAGEDLPDGFRWIVSRDGIRPVYYPVFLPATQTEWDGEDLVIGLVVDDEAKAYPVRFLSSREMVNDSVAGIPVLVTW